ncbi:MAG: head-tail connector protein [Hyphomicrobiales bacterium]|nr:head-tail connector protein [Hyphomicrobiales bacterium]
MSLLLTSGPIVEPVSLAEARAHLRIDTTDEDAYIASLITTSRLHIETALDVALMRQQWSLFLDTWPAARPLTLPLRPVMSLDAVRTFSPSGEPTTYEPDGFELDAVSSPARLYRKPQTRFTGPFRTANAIEIAFTAGFGSIPADVPAPLRQALLLLLAHWYEHREIVADDTAKTRVPDTISALLAPYRSVRL